MNQPKTSSELHATDNPSLSGAAGSDSGSNRHVDQTHPPSDVNIDASTIHATTQSESKFHHQPLESPNLRQEREKEQSSSEIKDVAKTDATVESPSAPSSTSGLVSPSSCSVASNDDSQSNDHKPKHGEHQQQSRDDSENVGETLAAHSGSFIVEGKILSQDDVLEQKRSTLNVSPQEVSTKRHGSHPPTSNINTSMSSGVNKNSNTLLANTIISNTATTSTVLQSPPRAGAIQTIQSKSKSKRPVAVGGSRKRSNSVPAYPLSSGSTPHSHGHGHTTTTSSSSNVKGNQLRRGKWTVEEEAYVARVIQDFNNGYLNAPAGTTLRTYLSDKLNCDPMRITKKFTGDSCIGKRVFHPAVRCPSNASSIDKAQSELDSLERRWRRRLDMQKRDAEKKQAASVAASAAAAAAAAASAPHLHDPTSALIRLNASALPGNRVVVTRTASWLDRANAILSKRRNASDLQNYYANKASTTACDSTETDTSKTASVDDGGGSPGSADDSNSILMKKEMQEVERLIEEGPIIQKSSGLLLQKYCTTPPPSAAAAAQGQHHSQTHGYDPPTKRKISDDQESGMAVGSAMTNDQHSINVTRGHASADTNTSSHNLLDATEISNDHKKYTLTGAKEKRLRKSLSTNNLQDASQQIRSDFNLSSGEAEDAASFIGFISSVREEAASSGCAGTNTKADNGTTSSSK